jgi:DNA-binding transcriptional LysR family regulator
MCKYAQMFDWNQLRILLAISRQRSLSGAARVLSVEHSTVSRQLAKLEQALQAKLFDRTPEGYVATPTGEAVLERARVIEEQALALERESAGKDARISGTVRISALDACVTDFILPVLPTLTTKYPELEVIVSSEIRVVDFGRREADIAIRYERPKEPSLVVRKLAESRSALYASKRYVRAHGLLRSATDLEGHRLVGLVPEYRFASEEQYIQRHTEGRGVGVRVDSQLTLREAIRAGAGIGILECYLADKDSKLVRVWQEPVLQDPWWLVVHEDLRHAARIRVVMDFLIENAAAQKSRLMGEQ